MNVHDNRFEWRDLAFINASQAAALEGVSVERDDVLLNITGASVARCCSVPVTALPARVNQHVAILRANRAKAIGKFIEYVLTSPHGKSRLLGIAHGGATREALTKAALERFTIPLPPLPLQCKITAILSAFDDLIENNNRRIKLLDEMAQRIYREWFVDLRYPGHENVPLVDSALGRIPQGWTPRTLGESCSLMQAGGTPSRGNPAYWTDGTVDWFTTTELKDGFLLASAERVTDLAVIERKTRVFPSGAVLMAIYGASIGRLGILTKEAACNQAALAMVGREIPQIVLYYMLVDLRAHFRSIAQGAAQQNISKQKVAETMVACPPTELCRAADEIMGPLWKQRIVIDRATVCLRAARDLLLPRLISGEIDVTDLDIAVPEGVA